LKDLNYIQDENVLENYEINYDDEFLDIEYEELQKDFLEKATKNDIEFLDYLIY